MAKGMEYKDVKKEFKGLTWGEFKALVEAEQGVTDTTTVGTFDFSHPSQGHPSSAVEVTLENGVVSVM